MSSKKEAVVLMDPLTSWKAVAAEAQRRGAEVCAVITNLLPTREDLAPFMPTEEDLLSSGVINVYTSPAPVGFDVYACSLHLKQLAKTRGFAFVAVVPLGETPVEYCDAVCAMLGLSHHNPLDSVHCRREKGFMKDAAAAAGLKTARYCRLHKPADVASAMSALDLDFPVVIKTPHGMSTTDVYICDTEDEACDRAAQIIGHAGPDSRPVHCVLLEEYISGDEFACNLLASPHLTDGMCVTDLWKYMKSKTNGTARYDRSEIMDPGDDAVASVVAYAAAVARAVGVVFGAAHVEVKADWDEQAQKWGAPTMIEVGARLSGGHASEMAQLVVPEWDPFCALLDAHSGKTPTIPSNFSPTKAVRHLFLPNKTGGEVTKVRGLTVLESLSTRNAHFILAKEGQQVQQTRDIVSCAGFVWLVGDQQAVDADTAAALEAFAVEVAS